MCERCRSGSAAQARRDGERRQQMHSNSGGAPARQAAAAPPAGGSSSRISSVRPAAADNTRTSAGAQGAGARGAAAKGKPASAATPATAKGGATPAAQGTRPPAQQNAQAQPDTESPDIVVPLIFPDYLIGVDPVKDLGEVGQSLVSKLLPGSDPKKGKLAGLGHAGVLFINGRKGTTKYYEYGRYDPAAKGLVQKQSIPDVVMKDGEPTAASLSATLARVSKLAGHGTRITGVYVVVKGKFDAMLKYCDDRMKLNKDPNRKTYSILRYNCMTFAKETAEAAGVSTPWETVHMPSSYMDEFREDHRTLDWDSTKGLVLGEAKE